jgi:hypothetical protein
VGLELLKLEARGYKKSAYALSTQRTYRSQLKRFLEFCIKFDCCAVPASQETILCYTVYLARSLNANSIPNYLNVIRLLHLEAGFDNPLLDHFELLMLKRGIKREKGVAPKKKLPLTVDLLRRIHDLLDFSSPADLSFWAAALIAFFVFLRKSSLLPQSRVFVEKNTLLRSDILSWVWISLT